jgi:transposase
MLGPAKPRRLDEPIAVSLDALVPRDHFYRHLEAKLDLGFVRGWVQELYAERGRPSIDPVVFFKLQLVMFFEGIRSERQLIETARLNLAHRWYLGYALDEALPDHSSLTRIRQRLGVDVFQHFFLRGLDNVNIEWLLVAIGQNLKRLLAATGWGRRKAPCGSLLALPREPERLTAVYRPVPRLRHRRTDLEWPETATPATGGFFQRPELKGDTMSWGDWRVRNAG